MLQLCSSWDGTSPIPGSLLVGLGVGFLQCQMHPCCLHLKSVRVGKQVLSGGTSCPKKGEQTEPFASNSCLHAALAGVTWPRGKSFIKRHLLLGCFSCMAGGFSKGSYGIFSGSSVIYCSKLSHSNDLRY